MNTDRLTVTVPHELGQALRKIAAHRHESVSSVVAEAIAHEVRSEALGGFLDETKKVVGPLPDALLRDADQILDRAAAKGTNERRTGGSAT